MSSCHQIMFHGITVDLRPSSVHIHNDRHLLRYLEHPGNQALLLANHVLAQYRVLFGRPLAILEHSLAIEIICHVFADKVADALRSIAGRISTNRESPLLRLIDRVKKGADVIDCGEAANDTNRFLWDMLVPFRAVVYAAAERRGDA